MIEVVLCRTFVYLKETNKHIHMVRLSVLIQNPEDVGNFWHIHPKLIFYFGDEDVNVSFSGRFFGIMTMKPLKKGSNLINYISSERGYN